MEISDVKRQVREAMAAAKRRSAERRTRLDDATRAWAVVLERIVVPISHQVAQVLNSENIRLQVSTPGDRVLIASEARPDDYVELSLVAAGGDAAIMVRVNRTRESVTEERELVRGAAAIESLEEEQLLEALLAGLAPWLAR